MRYKRLLTILAISILLITSVGLISAADDSISVKIVWEGDSINQPDQVTVNLIKDGKIVDTAKLNEGTHWKATFKVDEDGDYEVKEVISDDYSYKITGDADKGFTITNVLVAVEDTLGAIDDDTPLEDDSSDEKVSEAEDTPLKEDSADGPIDESNDADAVPTNETSDDNGTDNSTDNSTDNETEDDSDNESPTTTTTTTTTTTKIVKHANKKPVNNTTQPKPNNTGFPIVVLVVAVFVAAFVPFTRKK